MSQSHVTGGGNYFNNYNSFNTNSFNTVCNVDSFGGADDRSEILAWLSPLEPRIRHDDIRAHRVEDVGGWLLRTDEYQNWFDGVCGGESEKPALFCSGDPGVGKTYISSLVIDTLCDWARERNAAVACFYFDFAAQKEQSPTSVLGSLLKQIVGGLENIPAGVVKAFREQRNGIGGRKLGLAEIVGMLQDISSSRHTFICIDALDECVAEYRAKLLDLLEQILQESPGTRVFLAGRIHIQGEVERHLAGRVAVVPITPTKDDIIRFLRAKLKEDTTPGAIDKSLEEDIIKNILARISEIFLLVSLNIKVILQETTIHRRREKLGAMTNGLGLGDAYDATIGRIKAQGGDRARLGMAALMWISHSERPLDVDEICHALAVEIGSTDLNANDVPSIWTVLSCCQGLVAVGEGSSTIRLIHFTLKEYLSGHADLFDRAHSKIAETCLTYLNFQTIKNLSDSPSCGLQGEPLLKYSSLYWGTHARIELSDHSRYLALKLLDRYDNHISAKLLWESINRKFFDIYTLKPFSALHCISYFGIAEVAAHLVRMQGWDVNQRDGAGMTPLLWAARCGHEEVVKLLLDQKHTEPDTPDTLYGRTALSWAARNGHEGVVRLFLGGRFVDPEIIGGWWGIALLAMSLLFRRRYVDPNWPDNGGQTALLLAAKNGHDGVVKAMLVRDDVDPNRQGKWDCTPLSWAAKNGHDGIVKLLLEREDINPDIPDEWGQKPLSLAVKNGRGGVVELLLGRQGVIHDGLADGGQVMLLWAARNGHDGVVRLLLGREDVDPNGPDKWDRAPLSWAARNGHDAVVKLLLGRGDIKPERPDGWGLTPLSLAVRNGHGGVVKLLLGREDVRPDRPGRWGQTPLTSAAKNGHEGVVKLLLGRRDVNPVMPDDGGETPLSWAAKNGHDGVVKLLLGQEGVNPDGQDGLGQTPLSLAVKNGRGGVVELLLGWQGVSPDMPACCSQMLLLWAAKGRHGGVVKLLLGREGISPDRQYSGGQTPLLWAARNGHDGVVKLLLGLQDVNPDLPDDGGQTPLSWAARNGHGGVVKLLLWRADVNPNMRDNGGRIPLSWAAKNGHYGVMKLLLGRVCADPGRSD